MRDKYGRCAVSGCVLGLWLAIFLAAGFADAAAQKADSTIQPNATNRAANQDWWREKPMRMIQTNLREIDATMDLDVYVESLQDVRANVVLFNVGGIVCNYTTDLPFHFRNPHMKGDLVGEAVKRLHAADIRMIGRFDFSKINETIAAQHPDWLYVSEKGKTVNYNGQVHACINGDYQQKRLFDILGEALERYPLDGIFFNMIGYVTSDYSGNFHGVCQCDACKKRFKEWSGGLALPKKTGAGGDAWRKYEPFKRETSDELFHRVKTFVRERRPDVAICTYTPAGVDIVRRESNEDLGQWIFSASDNVKSILGSYKEKQVANAAVHFPAYPWRHASVSPHLTNLRLAQNLAHGGWLDYYCIGWLGNQEDGASLGAVQDVFRFHAKNEKWLVHTNSAANVLLVRGNRDEYRGLFKWLSETHLQFDVMDLGPLAADSGRRKLEDYELIVLPDQQRLDDALRERLDKFVEGGGKLLLTGVPGAQGAAGLKAAGIKEVVKVHPPKRGTYFRVWPEDKPRLGQIVTGALFLFEADIAYLDGDLAECAPAAGTDVFLGYIPVGMFGPPEKCYYSTVTRVPGLLLSRYGKGRVATFPWQIGRHYEQRNHHVHSALLQAAVRRLLGVEQRVALDSPLVEAGHRYAADGTYEWVALVNLSGQNGTVFHHPVTMRDLPLQVKPRKKVSRVRLLSTGDKLDYRVTEGGQLECRLPALKYYDVVLLEYE